MNRNNTVATIVTCILLATIPAFSQTKWFKYEGNPVLSLGLAGSWNGAAMLPGGVIFEDSLYRMWYSGGNANSGSNWRIGHATSPDGVTWTKNPVGEVLDPGPDAWESLSVLLGDVVRTDSGYRMWYTGINASGYYALGLARSPDGIVWSKSRTANPVLSQGSWYARGPFATSVLGPDSSGGYKMWFEGDILTHAHFQIGYAGATNDSTWTPMTTPVFPYGNPGSWNDDKVMAPSVLFNGQAYEMFYCGEQSNGRTQIGHATSPDGITWTRDGDNPVVERGPSDWDLQDIFGISCLLRDSIYHMWYGGTNVFGSFLWRIGYAVSPKGTSFQISTSDGVFNSVDDTVHVRVQVENPSGLEFSARVLSGGTLVVTVALFDDGTHEDSLAGDGIFANTWAPTAPAVYGVDLVLTLDDTLSFVLKNAATGLVTFAPGKESSTPERFFLDQNYPNPFNPSTKIGFGLRVSGYVSLKVFDMLGREVATLVNEELQPGSYEVTWDAAGFPSGIYFYRLQATQFAETKKLVLVR